MRMCLPGLTCLFLAGCGLDGSRSSTPMMPRIHGPWWQVAGNPDLGDLTGPPIDHPEHIQQPVDFSVWQAADGTWQLWSCIRSTKEAGHTRLFHRWQGRSLSQRDWMPMGIAMRADLRYEASPGGLQAPHVIDISDRTAFAGTLDAVPATWNYLMFYGDWDNMMIQGSADGKSFERWLYPNGSPAMFTEGEGVNTRDPMALLIGDTWHVYYTAYPKVNGTPTGALFGRTSKDLRAWSESKIVARGGLTGTSPYSCECPHVVQVGGDFYLFRTQRYAGPPTTSVFRSGNPLDFGIDDHADEKFVGLLEVAAPEIVRYEGRDYIAALTPDIQGIRIARLAWLPDGARSNHEESN